MRLSLFTWVLCGAALAAPSAHAELPDYSLQLQARANLRGNASGAYNLEPGNLLPGSYRVALNPQRELAFRLSITPEGRRAVWWGHDGMGQRLYLLPDLGEDVLAGDPDLNGAGDLAFSVSNASSGNGIYLFNVSDPSRVRIIREPLGVSSWSSLALNEAGQIAFRASFSGVGQTHIVLSPVGSGFTAEYRAKEKGVDSASPFTFLYSPAFNDQGQMAGVGDVRTAGAENFQELHVWNPGGGSQRVVVSRGLDASSPVFRFASVQPALSNTGKLAFLGTAKGPTGANLSTLWLWDGTGLIVLAQNGQDGIKELEIFPPDINDSGMVVFRAFDSAGLRAVWVSDGVSKKRVATEHDLVPTDLGVARLDQEKPSVPVFGGSTTINAQGDVTFVAGLAPPDNDQEEWGTGIFVARSSLMAPDGGTDGGPAPDAGPAVDGGTEPDGGPAVDGGEGPDGGPAWDGGAEPDGGPTWDAGPTPDGGSGTFDAGAGVPSDGGALPGNPDAGADVGTHGDETPISDQPDTGCGCQSPQAGAVWPWLLVGLMWQWGARRRRGMDSP